MRAYVRRNKTDAADCAAMLEAVRASDIKVVPIKTQYQQLIQLMHRTRQQWQHDRTARINLARAMLCEFGIAVPLGAETGQAVMRAQLANELLDQNLRNLLAQVLEEIEGFEQQIVALDRRMQALSDDDPVLVKLESLPGIGWITATSKRTSNKAPTRTKSPERSRIRLMKSGSAAGSISRQLEWPKRPLD